MSFSSQKTAHPARTVPIGLLRAVGFAEGISYLVLLGIAMPLKYLAGMPAAVQYVGWAHGLLFILFIAVVAAVGYTHRWTTMQVIKAVVASLVPFGPFVLDRTWRKEQA